MLTDVDPVSFDSLVSKVRNPTREDKNTLLQYKGVDKGNRIIVRVKPFGTLKASRQRSRSQEENGHQRLFLPRSTCHVSPPSTTALLTDSLSLEHCRR